jgi:hypothetical protein
MLEINSKLYFIDTARYALSGSPSPQHAPKDFAHGQPRLLPTE